MNRTGREDTESDNTERKALEARIRTLRSEGRTFSEIARLEGMSPSRARYLFEQADRRTSLQPLWTDGLNDRLANSLRWLGFRNREDVSDALKSGHLKRLARFERGLRGEALAELAQWLGLDGKGAGEDPQT